MWYRIKKSRNEKSSGIRKKVLLSSGAVLLAVIVSSVTVLADVDFEGWTDENQESAWNVLTTTDWSQFKDDLVYDTTDLDTSSSVAATNLSKKVEKLRDTVKSVCSSKGKTDYTEITLALIQILSGGNPPKKDPACVVKFKINGTTEVTSADDSIGILVDYLSTCIQAHNSKQNKDGTYWKASVNTIDKQLMSCVEGIFLTAEFSSSVKNYTPSKAKKWYKEHEADFAETPVDDNGLKLGKELSNYYKVTTVDGCSPTVDGAVTWMENIANNDTYGYVWGGNYDCSHLVCAGFQKAGIIKGYAPTSSLASKLKSYGFKEVTSSIKLSTGKGLIRGDVLLKKGHVECYVGNGKLVGAHSNKDGRSGDSSGKEICVKAYKNKGWKHVYRYVES